MLDVSHLAQLLECITLLHPLQRQGFDSHLQPEADVVGEEVRGIDTEMADQVQT